MVSAQELEDFVAEHSELLKDIASQSNRLTAALCKDAAKRA